jgi:hypothetical protein
MGCGETCPESVGAHDVGGIDAAARNFAGAFDTMQPATNNTCFHFTTAPLVLAISTRKNLPSTASILLKATATAIVRGLTNSLPILDVIPAKLAIPSRDGSG